MKFDISSFLTWNNFSIALDVLIIWYLVYRLIMLIRGTKAVQLAKGIVFIFIVRIIAGFLHLNALTYIVDQIVSWAVVGIIVIFQPEIRRGLERIGRTPLFGGREENAHDQSVKFIKELDKAIQYMSKRRIGALITIQQETGLDDYIETGIKLDADVSGELLINIFIPNTPLHDGAIIVRGDRIVSATCYLPLSDNMRISKALGTRHRAALGMSEVSDALIIVVSEETGAVSVAQGGFLQRNIDRQELRERLESIQERRVEPNKLAALWKGRRKNEKKTDK